MRTTERYIVEEFNDRSLLDIPTNLTNFYESIKHDEGNKIIRFMPKNKRKDFSPSEKLDRLEKHV